MEALTHLAAAIIGFLTGFSVKVVIDKRRTDRSSTSVTQKDNAVGGHMSGRDVNVDKRG